MKNVQKCYTFGGGVWCQYFIILKEGKHEGERLMLSKFTVHDIEVKNLK